MTMFVRGLEDDEDGSSYSTLSVHTIGDLSLALCQHGSSSGSIAASMDPILFLALERI